METPAENLIRLRVLERLVNSLPGQLAYWDKDLICRFANRAYLDWFAQPLELIVGMKMEDLLGRDLFKKNEECIADVLLGRPQSFIRPYRKIDGSAAKVHVQYVPDYDTSGDVAGFCVSVNDVTAFKHIEEQRREKEAELTTLVARRDDAIFWLTMAEEIAHVGHWRITLPDDTLSLFDRTLSWSDEMYRIHGVTPNATLLV